VCAETLAWQAFQRDALKGRPDKALREYTIKTFGKRS
jgi:hypothetical protein